ncbi:MAG: ATPase, T2SS/T4P/T4SS family [Bacillota bacterium]|nr:ATPase, T2SS/T4P/T4SS family [Bacillota bacterium]
METSQMSSSGKKIGHLLVESGSITREQLKKALELQESAKGNGEKKLLGQTLIELGFTTEEQVTRAMAARAGVEYYSLETNKIDSAAAALIDPDSARRYRALPVGFENDRLIVAMFDPNDILAIDDIRLITGYEVKPVCVPGSELRAAIDQFARASTTLEADEYEDEKPELHEEVQAVSVGKPAVQLANMIFSQAVRDGASDIHIEPLEKSMRIRFRIDGVLHEVMHPPYRLYPPLVSRIKVMGNMDIANRRIPQDGRISLRIDRKTIDFRVASLPTAYGEKLTLRILDRSAQLITLSELGFPESKLKLFRKMINTPHGCVLVTGPTGSGKTTTLYAALAELNQVEKHIITVEDPIEYRLDGINQVNVNPAAGLTFASGLRSILRNDPDIIMIGEIRDRETAKIAVESALTGHLVLSTLHTNDAAGAISRLTEMDVEPYLTASSVIAVLAQRLVRVLCKLCREEYRISKKELLTSVPDFPFSQGENEVILYKPVGCLRCSKTGYKGRVGVYELLIVSDEIKALTLQNRSSGEIAKDAVKEGMITLRQDGFLKVKTGITSMEEALRVLI